MPKILYLVTEDWFFCSHFLPMARAARAVGFEVVVATRVREHGDRLAAEGLRAIPIDTARGRIDPTSVVRTALAIRTMLAREKPDILHAIALPSVVLGGTAARLAGVRRVVLAPTGLGHLWIERGLGNAVVRATVRSLVGRLIPARGTRFLFENDEDPREFGLDPADSARVTLVGGAGIDPQAYRPMPEPAAAPVKFAVVSRMLFPKGIETAVKALSIARARGVDATLDLHGASDSENRRAIPDSLLREWSSLPGIRWHGPTSDAAGVWAGSHVAMLLSDREGLPRSLVEAMACGRPAIASDVPGCRTLVRDGIDGLLVPANDAEAAAGAIARLAGDPALRLRMGAAARARVERDFSESAVKAVVTRLYSEMLGA